MEHTPEGYVPDWPEDWECTDCHGSTLEATAMGGEAGAPDWFLLEVDCREAGLTDTNTPAFRLHSSEALSLALYLIRNLDRRTVPVTVAQRDGE